MKMQALSSILKHLPKRERIILYVAISIISLSVLDRLIIDPILNKLKTLNEGIEEKEAGIKRNLRILAHKDAIIAESAKYGAFLDNYETEEEEVTSILKEVEALANKESVYLVDMAPRRGASEMGESIEYSITLTCEAPMEQIIKFMHDIENSHRLLTIRRYELGPKSRDSNKAQCSMTVSKLVIPK